MLRKCLFIISKRRSWSTMVWQHPALEYLITLKMEKIIIWKSSVSVNKKVGLLMGPASDVTLSHYVSQRSKCCWLCPLVSSPGSLPSSPVSCSSCLSLLLLLLSPLAGSRGSGPPSSLHWLSTHLCGTASWAYELLPASFPSPPHLFV